MGPRVEIDELQGDDVLRAFADDLRVYASGPPPVIRPDLAAILATGTEGAALRPDPGVVLSPRVESGRRRLGDRLQGRRGRLALGAAVLSLTVLGTGGAGALPGPAQAAFVRAADSVGIELPDEARRGQTPPDEPSPVAPADPRGTDGPADDRPVPSPQDESRPDPAPEPGPPSSVPANTPSTLNPPNTAGGGPPGPEGLGRSGGDGGPREAEDRVPDQVPGPPEGAPGGSPTEVMPNGPPEGLVPDRERGEGAAPDDDEESAEADRQHEARRSQPGMAPGAGGPSF